MRADAAIDADAPACYTPSAAVDGEADVEDDGLWKGLDLSGLTVVLGAGTGAMLDLLLQRVSAASGQLAVMEPRLSDARELGRREPREAIAIVVGRPRRLPFIDEGIDLLVVNGTLREAPADGLSGLAREMWRVLVPGGSLRLADIVGPGEQPSDRAWATRNHIVSRLSQALGRQPGLALDVRAAAHALSGAGFEQLGLTLLPGYALSSAWLEDTVRAARDMTSGVADPSARHEIIDQLVPRLIDAFAEGGQRAAQRVVIRGVKPGGLAESMTASFSEADLRPSG